MKASGPGIGSEFGLSKAGGYQYSSICCVSKLPPGSVSYVANGRAAMSLAVRHLHQTAEDGRDRVLLPAYLCHSMIQPFLDQGLRIDFYPVAGDLSIHPVEVAKRVDDTTLVVLLMHYFGFGQPEDLQSSIVEDHPHVAIIDDRTHMLGTDLQARKMGSTRAICVYSPRKWGPFPDIGLVVWPHSLALSESLPRLMDRAYDFEFAFWRLVGIVLRSLYFAFPLEVLRGQSLRPFRRAEGLLNRRVRVCRSSPISRFLWYHWNWAEVWRIRRDNFQYLLDNWAVTDIEPLYRELPAPVCPLGFPVRTAQRQELRRRLISRQVFPPVHWVRPAEVAAQDFPQAALLAEEELTIPIDQRYALKQMDHILETVRQA
jgi:hypothetical protein